MEDKLPYVVTLAPQIVPNVISEHYRHLMLMEIQMLEAHFANQFEVFALVLIQIIVLIRTVLDRSSRV
jgi:hypothetical protein